jgi:hypothetical protein
LDATPAELEAMDAAAPDRLETMSPEEQEIFHTERERLSDNYQLLLERFAMTDTTLDELNRQLTPETRKEVAEEIIVLLTELQAILNDISLVQARARIERVSVEPIELTSEVALEIARTNRLDWMNNRAALVDVWRLIEFNANRLKSDLTVSLAGDVQTVRTIHSVSTATPARSGRRSRSTPRSRDWSNATSSVSSSSSISSRAAG